MLPDLTPQSAPSGELICAGEHFTDLAFFGLEGMPQLGKEVKTNRFAFSVGGGAAITATAAARLGCPTELLTAWSRSPLDARARAWLTNAGVSHSHSLVTEGTQPGITVALSTQEDRCFVTHPGANAMVPEFLLSPESLELLEGAGHVHFALTPVRWEPFVSAIRHLRARGVPVSWDLGWSPAAAESPGFREVCSVLSVLFLNEMEALRYSRTSSVESALSAFSNAENIVVIKQGRRGATASEHTGKPLHVNAIEVSAVDSTGAGDAFNGGFLYEQLAGSSLERSLQAGNLCGGLSTRSPGGVDALPDRREFERWFLQPDIGDDGGQQG